ncbi:MAG TPA: transposase [Clostridiaceae bacterium]|nr:transposase [Clostridiaceae bacterium]
MQETLLWLSMVTSAETVSKMPLYMSNGVSSNTLISLVRNNKSVKSVKHIGIDDWAFKKQKIYGTLTCDLETRRLIDILPNRDSETLLSWLKENPYISVVCHDRSSVYAGAVSKALPEAMQIVDRWHLQKIYLILWFVIFKLNIQKG